VDATPIGLADGRAAVDAMPTGPVADARPAADAGANISVTVTASCLFVRSGPGTANPKVTCTDTGAWCNVDNDVCIPMGETATVTGTSQAGAGCVMDWYPISYRTYQGWSCGSFLDFPTAARWMLPTDHETLYPSESLGPQG